MEVGAVALAHLAGVGYVAPAPAFAARVIAHVPQDVTVKSPRFLKRIFETAGRLPGDAADFIIDDDQASGFLKEGGYWLHLQIGPALFLSSQPVFEPDFDLAGLTAAG